MRFDEVETVMVTVFKLNRTGLNLFFCSFMQEIDVQSALGISHTDFSKNSPISKNILDTFFQFLLARLDEGQEELLYYRRR